ncbi:basic helix-loop-helix protein [Schaereria dolodes]|nr:basic helix-loop-helix protein [Schaereria dolodes]
MTNSLHYPDEERARIHLGINEVLQSLQASKKRKRVSSDQNRVTESAQQVGSTCGSVSSTMNDNGDNVNGDSFSDVLQDASQSTPDFGDFSQQLSSHASTSTHTMQNSSSATSTAAAALAAHMAPQNNDISFGSTNSGTDGAALVDSSFDTSGGDSSQNRQTLYNLVPFNATGGTAAAVQAAREASNGGPKPPVGSDEWHKVRRDNHKEVERRRRETINEGINELAKIVPGCEKNKGSILQRAVNYILQLKTAQDKSNETRALEKVVLEQVVDELSGRVDNLKKELKNAWAENERIKAENIKLKRTLANANVQVEGGDDAIGEMENGEDT